MSWFLEIGRVGDWRYMIIRGGDGFEVLRRDLAFDQVEEVIAFSTTLEEGVRNPSARRAFERFDREVLSKHKERVSFVAIHHFKKSDEQRGSSLTKILGATVIAGKTDFTIYLRQVGEGDGRRIVSAQARKGVPIEPTYLVFDDATQTSTLGQTLADERADAKKMSLSLTHAELRSRCIEVVAQNAGLSQAKCGEKVGGKTKLANDMFKSLIDDGVIVVQQGGATKTAHLLYLKGQEPTPIMPADYLTCADSDCTTQVLVRGAFCARHKEVLCVN
jgi:hypothetical protein